MQVTLQAISKPCDIIVQLLETYGSVCHKIHVVSGERRRVSTSELGWILIIETSLLASTFLIRRRREMIGHLTLQSRIHKRAEKIRLSKGRGLATYLPTG